MPTSVSYTIYRSALVSEGGSAEPVAALIRCAIWDANGPKRALIDWFDSLPLAVQQTMNGDAHFVVIPTNNHHDLSPVVQASPRLVFRP